MPVHKVEIFTGFHSIQFNNKAKGFLILESLVVYITKSQGLKPHEVHELKTKYLTVNKRDSKLYRRTLIYVAGQILPYYHLHGFTVVLFQDYFLFNKNTVNG